MTTCVPFALWSAPSWAWPWAALVLPVAAGVGAYLLGLRRRHTLQARIEEWLSTARNSRG
jgi:hypothetical protein